MPADDQPSGLDAATARLLHDTLCMVEEVRARFPGRDAQLLASVSTL